MITVWICAVHHPAFLCGGWAYVRRDPAGLAGAAGGDRRTTARRTAVAGLAAAMTDLLARDVPAAERFVAIHTPSPELAALAGVLAGRDVGPADDPELWAPIIRARATRELHLVRDTALPDSPLAFAAAWAEQGMGKAKAAGPFSAPIPKANLARIAGLPPV